MNKKRNSFVAIIMVAMMVLTSFSSVFAYGARISETEGDFDYYIEEGTGAFVSSYNGSSKTVKVPAKLGGQPVVGLDMMFFVDGIETLNLPATIEYGIDLLIGVQSLKAINIEDGGEKYFSKDGVVYENVPDEFFSTVSLAVYPAGKADKTFTIADAFAIGDTAFASANNLKEVIIGDATTSIGISSFRNCKNLEKVTIGMSVVEIKNNAFMGCSKLSKAYFKCSAPWTFGEGVFDEVAANFKIYYYGSASYGWTTPTWKGYPTEMINDVKPVTYKVTFKDGFTGEEIAVVEVEEGKDATPPTPPTHEGYKFVKWEGEYTNITHNTTVVAVYEEEMKFFKVRFFGFNDELLAEQTVPEGGAAYAPSVPGVEGYSFKGWDKEFTDVHQDLDVHAIYEVAEPVGMKGDVDGNGVIEAADATLILRHVAQLTVLEGQAAINADVDGNGVIEAADATLVLRFVAQLITSF